MPERLDQLRVALVGYREYDGGPPVVRVDLIDVQVLVPLVSLDPGDARMLGERIIEVADGAAPGDYSGTRR